MHIEKANIRSGLADHFLHNPESVVTLNLVAEGFPAALIGRGPFIPLGLGVISAGFYVVLHPILGGRASDEIESILI